MWSDFEEAIAVSEQASERVSSIQQVSTIENGGQGWVEAGVWLDVVLGAMVLSAVVGLTYTFLLH
jgi:hypothetical protein